MENSPIRLEPFTKGDFQQLIAWVNTEELLTNWAGSLFNFPLTEDSMNWYIEETNDFDNSDAFVFKAIDVNTNRTIGHISLGAISRKNRSGRISRVLIGENARGKGYCKAMVNALVEIGFTQLNLHKISLGVYDFNTSAIKCYKSCGFIVEGIQRDVLQYKQNVYWSLAEMSILEDEWRNNNQNQF